MADVFFDIGLMIIIATLFTFIAKKLKQPIIPAYIIAGLFIGPIFGFVASGDAIFMLSEIGIAFLLFIVGLDMDFKKLGDIGKVTIIGGIIKIVAVFIAGFVAGEFLGFTVVQSIYVALIVSFSSTMVVIKLLADESQLDSLHGKIIIGFLLIEDIFAILALSLLNTINDFSFMLVLVSLLKGLLLLAFTWFISRYVVKKAFDFAARSQEMLFLIALSSCFFFAILFKSVGFFIIELIKLFGITLSSHVMEVLSPGFSIAIGAFVAGLCIAPLPYKYEVIGKVRSLKDFFVALFFVSIGTLIVVASVKNIIIPLIVLVLIVIMVKPFVTLLLCAFFGYTKRTSFLAAMSLSQISEFGIIIVSQGILLKHVSEDFFTMVVLLSLITMIYTSYFFQFERRFYDLLSRSLFWFEGVGKVSNSLENLPEHIDKDVLLVGYDRLGYHIFKTLQKLKKDFLIVDFNPDIVKKLISQDVHCIYGDISDPEILDRVKISKAKLIISTVPDLEATKTLVTHARNVNKYANIIVTTYRVNDALELYDLGADYVILPHFLGGHHVSLLIEDLDVDLSKMIKTKIDHIKELKERLELGHQHPTRPAQR